MTDGVHIPQEDLALYAMQALSPDESAEMRLHLDKCAPCRAELAETSGDLALVALSVEQHPLPEGARDRFLSRISATSSLGTAAGPAPAVPIQPVAPLTAIAPSRDDRPARRPSLWIAWGAVAALAILAISLGLRIQSLDQQLQNQSGLIARLTVTASHAQEVLDVITAPSAQRVVLTSGKAPAVPTARAIYLPSRGGLIFEASNLGNLPGNKTYELWVIPASGAAPIPAGLFRPDAQGAASLVLPPLPKGVPAKAFGVTIENAEGSATPTAPIILSGAA
ncbi:MAG: anti-sigma factor [Terracidiphilus sp.]